MRQPARHTLRLPRLIIDWNYSRDGWGETVRDTYVHSYLQMAKVSLPDGRYIYRLALWRLHIAWGVPEKRAEK